MAKQKDKTKEEKKALQENDDRLDIVELQHVNIKDLYTLAKKLGVEEYKQLKKADLIFKILQAKTEQNGLIFGRGCLELMPDGYGFLRTSNYLPSSEDIYVSQTQIRRFGLSVGDTVSGQVRPPKTGERYFSLLRVEAINWEGNCWSVKIHSRRA